MILKASFHNHTAFLEVWISAPVVSPSYWHCLNISALHHSSSPRLRRRQMLRAKCSPALWVTGSKEAPQQRGFYVFLPFVSQSVLEQCGSAGGWLGGLLEQLIPDNVSSSLLWISALLGSEVPLTSNLPFVLAFTLSSAEEEFIVEHVFLSGWYYVTEQVKAHLMKPTKWDFSEFWNCRR